MNFSLPEKHHRKLIFVDESTVGKPKPKCDHLDTDIILGMCVCNNCGKIMPIFDTCEEWYNKGSRCSKNVQPHERGIFKDLENTDFPSHIIKRANEMFLKLVGTDTRRGQGRKGIICACLQNAYKEHNKSVTIDELCKVFGAKRKHAYRGLKMFAVIYRDLTEDVITARGLIEPIASMFQLPVSDIKNIIMIYDTVYNKSRELKRAEPKSLAAGLAYYYMKINDMHISKKEFAKIVGLSDITIQKIYNITFKLLAQ